MARDADLKTTIDPDGLRYRSKTPGSPFAPTGAFAPSTMSCFLCGKHRARHWLKTRKLLGKTQCVCAPSCKELDASIAAHMAQAGTGTNSTPAPPDAAA